MSSGKNVALIVKTHRKMTTLVLFTVSVAEALMDEFGSILSEFRDIPAIQDWAQVTSSTFILRYVSCTTSLFGLGSFLDSIEHDFIRI